MLESLRRIFSGVDPEDEADLDHRLQVVTAALFIEMCRADKEIQRDEVRTAVEVVRRTFDLDPVEAKEIMALAEGEADDAVSLYRFTSHIDRHFSPPEKIRLIENLWKVAFADDALDKHEEYLVRKISDLIHVSHGDFIQAKLRVVEGMKGSGS